jgi:hypothetical protein
LPEAITSEGKRLFAKAVTAGGERNKKGHLLLYLRGSVNSISLDFSS